MACHFPRQVWRRKDGPGFTFRFDEGLTGVGGQLPCGQCIGCRLDWAGDWATRCEKEAQCWPHNVFVTLTYDDKHLPIGGSTRSSVSKREFQLFLKRLRKEFGDGIRFFASGEYGEKSGRAHYHALLFNHRFPDAQLWRSTPAGPLFTSAALQRLWPFGFSSIGSVTFQSASYVARYVLKKAKDNPSDFLDREPPFVLMSRRPGIGAYWLEKHLSDVYPAGRVVVGLGALRRPPRYFDEKLKVWDRSMHLEVKGARRLAAPFVPQGDVGRRLYARNVHAVGAVGRLPRSLD